MEDRGGISLLSDEEIGEIRLGLDLVSQNLERLTVHGGYSTNHDIELRLRSIKNLKEALQSVDHGYFPAVTISDSYTWTIDLMSKEIKSRVD